MMRLSVCMGTEQEYAAAVDSCRTDDDIRGYYTQKLKEAESSGCDHVDFKSFEPGLKTTEAFRVMGLAEEAVLTFFHTHDKPATVRFVCTDEETARLYKVVYNFRFADSKESRMLDESWD